MPEATPRGRFVWYELMTTDPDAAREFYTDVVGWGTTPFEGAPMPYTMWTKSETPVGGLMELPEEARARGVQPHWEAYVAVPDVDATAARAEAAGARILMGPETLPEVGRMVIFADPQGAVIAAFRGAQEMPSADSEPEPGDFSWRELATTDHEAAFDFYSDLFGWEKTDAMDMGEAGVYQMYGRDGTTLGGMYTKTAEMPGPPAWLYYVRVDDLDARVKKVEDGGGNVVNGPMEVPGGSRIAVCTDPQGAVFALHEAAS